VKIDTSDLKLNGFVKELVEVQRKSVATKLQAVSDSRSNWIAKNSGA